MKACEVKMKVDIEAIEKIIEEHYAEKRPDLIITKRLLSRLCPIVAEGLEKASDGMTMESAMPFIDDFLEKENIIEFIKERQPNLKPVPGHVVVDLRMYFEDFLPNYTICHIYRKSNYLEDSNLYSVTARNTNGTYSCWSSWNEGTQSLNHGHYNLSSEEDGINILAEYFSDVTDEPDKYGMFRNYFEDFDRAKDGQGMKGNIIPIGRHKNAR